MSLAVALIALIQESKLSLRCIAKRSGVHVNLLSRHVRGEGMLGARNMQRVMDALSGNVKIERDAK